MNEQRRYRNKFLNTQAANRLLAEFGRRRTLTREQMLAASATSSSALSRMLGSLESDFDLVVRLKDGRYSVESWGKLDFRAFASPGSTGRLNSEPSLRMPAGEFVHVHEVGRPRYLSTV